MRRVDQVRNVQDGLVKLGNPHFLRVDQVSTLKDGLVKLGNPHFGRVHNGWNIETSGTETKIEERFRGRG